MHKPSRHQRSDGKALLIDLDNLVINGRGFVSAEQAESRLRRVVTAAGPVDHVLAVAPRTTVARFADILAALGIRWELCERGPDAADRAICLIACDLVELGYDHMFIASGDHFFICVTAIAKVTIVLPAEQQMSRHLARHALRLAA